jgi:hypothetical protein
MSMVGLSRAMFTVCFGCWSVVCCLLTWRKGLLLANLMQSCTAGEPETVCSVCSGLM